jgi:hypothetical protein
VKAKTKAEQVKYTRAFSKLQLFIFVIVFGLTGFLIYKSFALPPLVATIQAEAMSQPAAAKIVSDYKAANGQAVKLSAFGELTGSVNLASDASLINLVTRATKCDGSWPKVGLSLDDDQIVSATVRGGWKTISAATTATKGPHKLTISYLSASKKCVPPLYIDAINIYGSAVVTPSPSVSLVASPNSIVVGQSSTLAWTAANAKGCVASGAWSGRKDIGGSQSTGILNQTVTYTLTCSGDGGAVSTSTTIHVSLVKLSSSE